MNKATKLGMGASFQQARPVSARRAAIEASTAAPTEGAIPPQELPVSAISLNPDNPRRNLGDLTDLGNSMRDHGQKTAISIMSRFAYLEGNPGREADLEPGTRYVVIDGNSRLAAAREAGLQTIKVMVDDGLGSNSDEILESALVANIHRNDLDHLDEARALEQLLKIHGTQEALAARLHRSQPWVSGRLALLKLTPELQHRLESGEESADLLRKVGNKKPEQQEEHLAKLKQQREAATSRKERVQPSEVSTKPGDGTGPATTKNDGQPPADPSSAESISSHEPGPSEATGQVGALTGNPAVSSGGSGLEGTLTLPDPRPSTEPEPNSPVADEAASPGAGRDSAPAASAVPVMPWGDGRAVMDIATRAMDEHQRGRLVSRYFEAGDPDTLARALRESCDQAKREELASVLAKVADLLKQD
ncbi:ParB/RepB/Spo0J family partition protein [Streptomyces sp. NPDC054975]